MKTLPTLFVLALLVTLAAAWLLPQGVSRATDRTAADVPVTVSVAAITTRSAAPAPARAAPQAAPTLVVKPVSEKQRALLAAFQADDLCEASRLLNEASSEELYGAYLGAIAPGGETLETYGREGPMLADKIDLARKFKSRAARTAWALKVGGLGYFPVTASGSDPEAARTLLLELEKEEPGNAFFPLFRLVLESRLGYTNDKLKATAESAASGSFLDSHLREVERELTEGSWQSASLRYARTNYQGGLNVRYYDATGVLKRLEKDAAFAGNGRIADLLAEEGQHAERGPYAGGFDIDRYFAASALDTEHVESFDALVARRGWRNDSGSPNLFRYEDSKQICEPLPYQEHFAAARGQR